MSLTKPARHLLAALLILVVSCWIAAQIQTAGGDVHVHSIKIPTQNGQWIVADLFKPRSATAETPAPFVVVVPGFQRSKEALSNIAIELARRGFVARRIDPYAQGGSSASLSRIAATTEGYGMFAVVDYVASTDQPQLHRQARESVRPAIRPAATPLFAARITSAGRRQRTGLPSKLHSVFVSGYVLTLTDEVLQDVRSNVGVELRVLR